MPSPFPGMDPYLEAPAVWAEFHGEYVYAIRERLAAALAPRYVVRVDRHVYVAEPDEDRQPVGRPDVFVAEGAGTLPAAATSGIAAAPLVVQLPGVTRRTTRFVRVEDGESRQVVTVLELLSPANKGGGPDRAAYLAKRGEYLAAGVHLIEIDLLRRGQRMPVDVPPATAYLALVSRASEFPHAGVWPFGVRDPLPRLPVPLNDGDADASLDLAAAFTAAYDRGGYTHHLDYARPPCPPLPDADAAWVRDLLAARPAEGR